MGGLGLRRRDVLRTGMLAAGALAMGPGYWRQALAQAPAHPGPGPYGPLQPADLNGLMLPQGFSSRIVATGNQPMPSAYTWHLFSDGAATYPTPDGGWILVSNSEVPAAGRGGASAIRFGSDGTIADAYRILGGTQGNCAGGLTPWGTWLSCEEFDRGRVWECDPAGQHDAVVHPPLGVFSHEATCVDPVGRRLYLTEDDGDSRLYRFTPDAYPSLARGILEVATVAGDSGVTWTQLPDPQFAGGTATRAQVPGSTRFRRGEGTWFDSGFVYVATTSDDRVYAYDTSTETMEVLYDGKVLGAAAPLHQVDNVTVHPASGDLFVGEDNDDLELCLITSDRVVASFVRMSGAQHQGAAVLPPTGEGNIDSGRDTATSEVTGPCFNPDGTRLYFSSQRAFGVGAIYEISGPFRRTRTPPPLPPVPPEGRRPGGDGRPPVLTGFSPDATGAGGAGVRALRLDARARLALSTLRRSGVRATLEADAPGTYTIALTATFTPAPARGRRRARAPRAVTLGRARVTLGQAGRAQVRVRLTKTGRAALRDRRRRLLGTLVASGPGGTRASRPIVLEPPAARRRA